MVQLKPTQKSQKGDRFQLNSGIDTVNDPLFLPNGKMTIAKDVVFYDTGWTRRPGVTLDGASGSSNVNAMGSIKLDSGNIRVRCYGTKFQKKVTGTWTDIGGVTMTDIKSTIVSFLDADMTNAATKTGTAAVTSTNRTLDDSVGAMTINLYAGKTLLITSGTGSGQSKFITSNDILTFYIDSVWETTPDATSVYAVRPAIPHVFVTNGTDTVFKYDGTTVTTFSTMTKWHTLEVAHDRLWGARQDLDIVFYSNLGTSYFSKDQNIPIDTSGDSITRIMKNHEEITVYKKNQKFSITGYSEDQFQLVNVGETVGAISPWSVAHGQNFNLFLGYGGIYCVNSLNQSSVDEGLPASKDINDLVLGHSSAELLAAEGWIYGDRYYLSIGEDTFVYDFVQGQRVAGGQSLAMMLSGQQVKANVWTVHNYADPIRRAYVESGIAYVGSTTQLYSMGGNTDNGTPINVQVRSDKRSQGDRNANKIYGVGLVSFSKPGATCNITISYSIEGGSFIPFIAQDINQNSTIRCPVSAIGKNILFDYAYSYTGANPPQFVMHEQFVSLTSKPI